jgi:hypothetical protein
MSYHLGHGLVILFAGDQMITKTPDTRDRKRVDDVPRMLFQLEWSCFPELLCQRQYAREPSY